DSQTLTRLNGAGKPPGEEPRDAKSRAACYTFAMFRAAFVAAILAVLALPLPAGAQYVIVLKNGRQIHVQNYREDGAMIKFSGLGGEIGIAKDQVQSIRRAGESAADSSGLALDRLPAAPAVSPAPAARPADQPQARAPASASPETAKQKAAEEEKAYREKVKDLNLRLKDLRERYALITRGNRGNEPQFFTTEEAFQGHQDDLLSRLRDAQNRQQGLATGAAVFPRSAAGLFRQTKGAERSARRDRPPRKRAPESDRRDEGEEFRYRGANRRLAPPRRANPKDSSGPRSRRSGRRPPRRYASGGGRARACGCWRDEFPPSEFPPPRSRRAAPRSCACRPPD